MSSSERFGICWEHPYVFRIQVSIARVSGIRLRLPVRGFWETKCRA